VSGVHHPPGCRCPGCLPSQYVMRPAASQRPVGTVTRPARKGGISPSIVIWGGLIGGWLFLGWPAYVWHGENATGGWAWDSHSTIACCIWWGILLLGFLIYGMATGKLGPGPIPEPAQRAPLPLSVAKCAAKGHPGAVPVESALDKDTTVAWWCPSCETQLDVGWNPANAGIPSSENPLGGWVRWSWHCTCRQSRSSLAPSEAAAKTIIDRSIADHVAIMPGFPHQYEYEWEPWA
jgi:hypothetical protein